MAEKTEKKTATTNLKMLREERKESIGRARKAIKEHNKVIKTIKEALVSQARTIPDLAAAVSMETDKVLVYVSTLKKYGEIGEGAKQGDYFTYELIGK